MHRSTMVTVGLVAALSVAMTGCGTSTDDDPDYRGVCVDERTDRRVDDVECDDDRDGGHSRVVFFPRGSTVPPVGGAARSGGLTTVPDGYTSAKGGAPVQGGTVARGGFGASGGGEGGSVGG